MHHDRVPNPRNLIAAYVTHYNASYADPIKHFTPDDVRTICVTPLVPTVARAKGLSVMKVTQQIEGFGYVDA